jgi:Uma2 family endonuclease
VPGVIEKQPKRWTYEEYYKLDDNQRYEIIDGNLLMAPSPDLWHQDWLGSLYVIFKRHLTRTKAGRVFMAPCDVVLDEENTVQPDLIFVSSANARILQHRAIFGTPDLLIELISPSGVRRDRHVKKALYARFGVREYWIGDATNKSMEIFILEDGGYKLRCAVKNRGKLTSRVLPGLTFDLADIEPE